MFVREKGRGGIGGSFLPGIDVFSVQVMDRFLPNRQTVRGASFANMTLSLTASDSQTFTSPSLESTILQVDGKAPVVNVRTVTQLQPMAWL